MKSFITVLIAGFLFLPAGDEANLHTISGASQQETLEGTVKLAKKSPVIRPRTRGRYGMSAGHRRNMKEEVNNPVLIWVEGNSPGSGETGSGVKILNQKDQRFDPGLIAIRQGGTVRIKNSDPVYHNVFSLSSTKKFDVGRRPKNEFKDVTFDKPGVVDVFCDIHSNMHAVIYVMPPEAVAWTLSSNGTPFEITGVPPGTYGLHIYAPGYDERKMDIRVNEGETKQIGSITLSQ